MIDIGPIGRLRPILASAAFLLATTLSAAAADPVAVVAADGPTAATLDAIAAVAREGDRTLTIELVGLNQVSDDDLIALIEEELRAIAADYGFAPGSVEIVRCPELACR